MRCGHSGGPASTDAVPLHFAAKSERVLRLYWSATGLVTANAFWSDAVDGVQAIVNLALARGDVGRSGAGLMPIRGHSGVQGGAEMGAYATALPGGVPVDPEGAAALGERWGFPVPPAPGIPDPNAIPPPGANPGEAAVPPGVAPPP